jgi:hypothetical protein
MPAPEIVSFPVPEIAALKSSVPDLTSSVPVLVTAGAIVLVPVPPVFSKRPALSTYDAVELPRPIPPAPAMSYVPVAALSRNALSPLESPIVTVPPLCGVGQVSGHGHRGVDDADRSRGIVAERAERNVGRPVIAGVADVDDAVIGQGVRNREAAAGSAGVGEDALDR